MLFKDVWLLMFSGDHTCDLQDTFKTRDCEDKKKTVEVQKKSAVNKRFKEASYRFEKAIGGHTGSSLLERKKCGSSKYKIWKNDG